MKSIRKGADRVPVLFDSQFSMIYEVPVVGFFQEHDSFRAFRSQNLNLEISMDTKPKRDNTLNVPSCLFYASTLKFLDKIGVNKCVYSHFI